MTSAFATPAASATLKSELDEKHARLTALMEEQGWTGILFRRHENIAWATAGLVEARVGLASETAVCSLLFTREGGRFCIAPNNEAARLADEEFAGLDFEAVIYPWTEDAASDLAHKHGGPEIGADTAEPGLIPWNFTEVRAPLLAGEVERFRTLGKAVAETTTRVLKDLAPGMTEDEMAARISAGLLAQHITPSVLLMATDERIFHYRHAVPRKGVLRKYGMLNLCARRSGLVVSITRFVHFGALPAELAANFERAAGVNAELLHASREGATAAQLYAVAARAYATAGFSNEITRHHQGGPCGYLERDWVARPGGTQVLRATQGLAWNPSLQGAKAEDTALLRGGAIEILTGTPELPVIESKTGGSVYRSAGVFLP